MTDPIVTSAIENALNNVLGTQGQDAGFLRDNVHFYVAEQVNEIGKDEPDEQKRNILVQGFQVQFRKRLTQEISQNEGTIIADHLRLVLKILGEPRIARLEPRVDAEAVQHNGVWYVAFRTPGAPTDLCSAQQARDRAQSLQDRGHPGLAEQIRNVAADVEQRNAKLST